MPADASIYNQQQPAKFNTPFEFLPQMLQLKQQQEVNRSLVQQRETATAAARQKSEEAAREAAAASQVRALFNRLDPATQQPVIPQMEELAGVIGPEKAVDIFKGFEALRTARSGNAAKDTERIAQVLGGVESMPGDLRAQAYEGALAQLVADGTLKPGQAPAKYDTGFVKAKRREALSVLQQFEQDKPPADYTLGNQRMSGATNQAIATAAPDAPKLGSFEDHLASVAAARGLKPNQLDPRTKLQEKARFEAAGRAPVQGPQPGYQWVVRPGADGKPEEVYTNQVKAGDRPQNVRVKPTEDERKSSGFYDQMSDAINTIDQLEGAITETEMYQIQTLPQEELIGMLNRNKLSEGAKRYLRAFEQFTEARLRPVSGAAITDGEYARDRRTYAKQYGETPTLAKDRKRARAIQLDTLKKRAGVAFDDSTAPKTPGKVTITSIREIK